MTRRDRNAWLSHRDDFLVGRFKPTTEYADPKTGILLHKGAIVVNDNLQAKFAPTPADGPTGSLSSPASSLSGPGFAMGDCMVHPASGEVKLGHTAEVNAHLVVENVRRASSGRP